MAFDGSGERCSDVSRPQIDLNATENLSREVVDRWPGRVLEIILKESDFGGTLARYFLQFCGNSIDSSLKWFRLNVISNGIKIWSKAIFRHVPPDTLHGKHSRLILFPPLITPRSRIYQLPMISSQICD